MRYCDSREVTIAIFQTEKIAFKVKIVKISNIYEHKNKYFSMQHEQIVLNQIYQWGLSGKTNWNCKNRRQEIFVTNIYPFLVNFTHIFSITKYYGIAIYHLLWKFITQLRIKIISCGQKLYMEVVNNKIIIIIVILNI